MQHEAPPRPQAPRGPAGEGAPGGRVLPEVLAPEVFALLRCPYCGGRLELVADVPHERRGDALVHAVVACHCCTFPVVSGIPVLHLEAWAVAAREALEAGDFQRAEGLLLAPGDEARGTRFQQLAATPDATYRALVEVLGTSVEGGYFLYRFSDPTYLVARAVVEALAPAALAGGGRAIDLCGGSGHLTRALLPLSPQTPVIADLYFAKLWLARRFVAPGCAPVCCDANAPLPFARATFAFALCSDMFHYLWTKRQLVGELERLVDRTGSAGGAGDPPREGSTDRAGPGVVVISHTHNQREWSPSFGQPLPPEGYAALFETLGARVFGETTLLDDVVTGGPLDLSRRQDATVLDADPALTVVASRRSEVFAAYPLGGPTPVPGELRLNPLYRVEGHGEQRTLRLSFPSEEYEEEYGAARRYLPEAVEVDPEVVEALEAGDGSRERLEDLIRKRVVLDLPERYC